MDTGRPQCKTDRVVVVEPDSIRRGQHDWLPPTVIVAMILVVSCLVATGYQHGVNQIPSTVTLIDGNSVALNGVRHDRYDLLGTRADGTQVAIPLWRVAMVERGPKASQ